MHGTNQNTVVEVDQEEIDKPIASASELMSNLYLDFTEYARHEKKATNIGMQIVFQGRNMFKDIITPEQEDRLTDIMAEVRELSRRPINRRTKTIVPQGKYILICDAVGIITAIADLKGLIIREKLIRENTMVAVDHGLEGYSPASKNITEQDKSIHEKYEKD